MPNFRLKTAAKSDLKQIANFTERKWERKQRNKYLADLDYAFHQLAENSALGKTRDHIRSGYRSFPVRSHVIFYRVGHDNIVEIIRIFHKRMDVSIRLK